MISYILRRLLFLAPVLVIVGSIVFLIVHLTPGDPAVVILGPDADSEDVERLREQLGLNDPIYIQFARWFADVVRLDFGDSIFLNAPVTEALLGRAEPTLLLTVYALSLSILVGVPTGMIAALRRNSLTDRLLMITANSGLAIPNFFLGILLILVFAVHANWLPAGGYVNISEDPQAHLKSMVMPAIALGFFHAALLARLVRSSMLEVLHRDYIRTAMAKGLRRHNVITRHALRNALMPVITVIGLSLGGLLGGSIVTETVFNIPGMGRLIVQSIGRRDFPVIQGVVMVIAGIYLLSNLLVDVLYVYIDPRIRYGNK